MSDVYVTKYAIWDARLLGARVVHRSELKGRIIGIFRERGGQKFLIETEEGKLFCDHVTSFAILGR